MSLAAQVWAHVRKGNGTHMGDRKHLALFVPALIAGGFLLAACGTVVQPTPTAAPGVAGAGAAQKAAQALAAQLKVDPSDVAVSSVEAAQWPDSCLGIQLPGQFCAMHVVDGYKVILKAQGRSYEYRTDADGNMALPVLALTWHREGGIAGFCDHLVVDQTGVAVATNCRGELPEEVARSTLDAGQLGQLQTWLASLSPFEVNQTDDATADAMTIRLSFHGQGAAAATNADRRAIEEFAAQVYATMSQE